ncbi:hypothetical protein Q73_03355 [Bacillus coahuilensis m2-6]|uniref:Uncharacterized protein n=1 Tax=Bacillus coahuilensis p1.1.43 TaxID=1150625 RepID=A0A147KAZ5_9BACI|nr:hypothetical protein [Bacillus coahuilensis]KUP07916.1 hypothetical protein Q75_03935 [Bacillus coahuilensis p1.1.43]KUP09325.1 hypothetical protein Q73_03355 [Bacillus coahuilensis m2-6]
MELCPLCNGMKEIVVECRVCQGPMKDGGRAYDYFDDYSAYMDIDSLKLVDGRIGVPTNECLHIFVCNECPHQDVKSIPYE